MVNVRLGGDFGHAGLRRGALLRIFGVLGSVFPPGHAGTGKGAALEIKRCRAD